MGLKSFLQTIIASNMGDGWVTGGDYEHCSVSLGKLKDGTTKLSIVGVGQELVYVEKSDVKEFAILETGAKWAKGNKNYVGNRYKVVLNNGKAFIISIIANSTSRYEAYFML